MHQALTRTLVGAGVVVALLAGTVPAAQAHTPHVPGCTVTKAERVEIRDQVRTLRGDLRGDRLTATERAALHRAVREMYTAARDAKMTRQARRAKRAEFVALAHRLGLAATAEERTAIRTEMRAIALELKQARLTPAERREIRKAVRDLHRTLRTHLTRAERRQVHAEVRALLAGLACRVSG